MKVGIPSREILRMDDEVSPSLVVMGARGMILIKDIPLGSVSSDVLRYGKTNLLIMRHKVFEKYAREAFEEYCDRIFSTVLYATDFPKSTEQTLSILRQLPDTDEIILVHAVDKGEIK